MFIIASAMQKDFHNHATLEMLKNIPDMTWTPSIPHRFAGMSEESLRGMLLPKGKQAYFEKTTLVGAAPAAFNWQDAAPECMVVRDQGQCGSCWAFSSVGPFSDNRCFSKKDATRVIYSEQYMVSCDSNNLGCNGGYLTMDQYFLKKTGVPTDKCVSYKSGSKGVTGKCPTTCDDKSPIVLVKSTKFEDVCTNEESIKVGLTQGALQTAFTVYSDFMYYNGSCTTIRALIRLHDLDTQVKSEIMIFSFYIGIYDHNICYIAITNEKIAPEPVRSVPPPHMNREFQFNSEIRQRHANLYGRQSN
ncbi:Cathepsin_B [Hexamita inflata]|uniref:Cathepsin B n=1 Tax=Hexamita inflata TaxID=28002 RepID=A0AA86PNA1_9EUKA|nr:Cathepsin B [Hexamita inflata]